MIRAIAIDDEPPALSIITAFAKQTAQLNLIQTFTQVDAALECLQTQKVDLLFLDIQMPTVTGLEVYHALKNPPMVIFATAFSEYAVEGFNVNAIDYLLKPFSLERFQTAVTKAQAQLDLQIIQQNYTSGYLHIKAVNALHKILFDAIIYLESLDDYVKIYRQNNTPILARITMKTILEQLPVTQFARIHRSYVVNMKHIDHVKNKNVHIQGVSLPISHTYEPAFIEMITSKNHSPQN